MKKFYVSALSAREGGGVTYLDKILPLFPSDPANECHVIASKSFTLPTGCPENVILHQIPNWMNNPFMRFLFTSIYYKFIFFKNMNIDVFFYPGGSIDIPSNNAARTIVAFRNMLPFDKVEAHRYPLGYMRFRNWLLFYIQRASFKKATNIIFISNYAKTIMKKIVPDAEEKSVVIYHGVDDHNTLLAGKELYKNYPEGYVLYVSTIDVYKAQLEVIQAWKLMKSKRLGVEKLLLVGSEYKPYAKKVRKLIAEFGLENEVILLGKIKRTDLPSLYKGAILNIYASSCENCPNILLEILSSGSPVLCSNVQPMPEIGGDELIYFNPYDPKELSEKLVDILSDKSLLAKQATKSHERSLNYSWTKTANETWSYILNV